MIAEDVIVKKIQAGDIKTFQMFFESNYIQFYIYCRKYISDPDDAKDVLQNIFLHVWEKRESLTIHTSLQSYMYRIIHNESLNFIRNRRSLSFSELDIDDSFYVDKCTEDKEPDAEIMFRELELVTEEAIEKLPDQCRYIFKLSRVDGKKNKEIAEELDLSVRTVETQIYRALKLLKERLKEYIDNINK